MPNLSRRAALAGVTASLVSAMRPATVFAQVASAVQGPFTLPPLPYGYDANEPKIDTLTMQLHHDRHHAAYVANLNAAVRDHPQVAAMSVDQILARLSEIPDTVRTTLRDNAGGHANHSMFWQVMGGKGGTPNGAVAEAIRSEFGDFESLKGQFDSTGAGSFGSGWVFVSVTRDGKLGLEARPNEDTPLMDRGRVLFGNDLWEHAYYLKYQNRRADYLAAWWDVLDWQKIGARYEQARAGTLLV